MFQINSLHNFINDWIKYTCHHNFLKKLTDKHKLKHYILASDSLTFVFLSKIEFYIILFNLHLRKLNHKLVFKIVGGVQGKL